MMLNSLCVIGQKKAVYSLLDQSQTSNSGWLLYSIEH